MTIESKVNIGGSMCPVICPENLRKGYLYTRHTYEVYLPVTDSSSGRITTSDYYRWRIAFDSLLQSLVDLFVIEDYTMVGDGWWLIETVCNAPIAWLEFIADTFVGEWRVSHPFAHYITSKGAE